MNNVKAAYLNPATVCNFGAMRWALFLAIFSALAVLLPYISHQFGFAGVVFLPMHFAVLIAAIVMGMRGGVMVALISPALSHAISAMPPAASLLPMTVELAAYAMVVNVAVRRFRMPLIISLIAAMIAGRLVSMVLVSMMLDVPITAHLNSLFIVGIPGIIIQLAFVPLLSTRLIDCLGNK